MKDLYASLQQIQFVCQYWVREALETHLCSTALCFIETYIHRTFDYIHVALKVSKM